MVSNQQSKPPISPDTVSLAQQGPSLPLRSLESPQMFSRLGGWGGTAGENVSCLSRLPCQLYNFPSLLCLHGSCGAWLACRKLGAAGPAQSTSGSLKLCVKFASPFMTDDIAYFALCVLWKFQ